MRKFIDKITEKRTVSILLELLFLSLPFGSYILSFSLGFMTVYPSLVIILTLTLIGLIKFKTLSFNYIEKYTLLFLSTWLIYALIYLPFIDGKANAIIDIRSLSLMLFFTFTLFWTSRDLGFKVWKKIVFRGIKIYFFLLLIFAFLEYQTGIHFQGYFTNKLLDLEPSLTHYAPIFIYDNPNNFISTFILLGILILSLSKVHRENNYALAFISTTIYFAANMTDARLGKMIALILIFHTSIVIINKKLNKQYLVYLTIILSTYLVFSQPKYFGPVWQTLSKNYQKKKKPKLKKDSEINSFQIRKNLFYNSIEALATSSYIGIGPGQFREYSLDKRFKENTNTNINPHSWFFEIFSQYGIFIFIGYCFIFVLILKKFKENLKNHSKEIAFLFIAMICFGISSLLPSSFLIMEINWIFLSILIILSSNFETDGK